MKLENVNNYLPRKYVDFIDEPSAIIRKSLTYCLSKADLWDLRYNENKSGLTFEKLKKILKAGDKKI